MLCEGGITLKHSHNSFVVLDHISCFAGFSRQVLQVLSGYKFGSFDILTDEEVRQGKRIIIVDCFMQKY